MVNNSTSPNNAALGFEQTLWDAADYKHVVLGLIFLKYISDAFTELYRRLAADPLSNRTPKPMAWPVIRSTRLLLTRLGISGLVPTGGEQV